MHEMAIPISTVIIEGSIGLHRDRLPRPAIQLFTACPVTPLSSTIDFSHSENGLLSIVKKIHV